MELASFVGGPVRAPLPRPGEAARVEIAQLLSDASEILNEVNKIPASTS